MKLLALLLLLVGLQGCKRKQVNESLGDFVVVQSSTSKGFFMSPQDNVELVSLIPTKVLKKELARRIDIQTIKPHHEVVAAERTGTLKFYETSESSVLMIDEDGDIFLRDKWIGKDSRLGDKRRDDPRKA